MNLITLTTDGEFASLEKEWEMLLSKDILSNNFLSFHWVFSWWKAYRPNARLHIVTVRKDNGELIAIAPLMKLTIKDSGFTYVSLSFIGDGTDETDHMSFVLHKDYLKESIDCILASIQRDQDWDVLSLNMIQEKAVLKQRLEKWASLNHFLVGRQDVPFAASNLPDSFEKFLENLQPRFRTKLRSSRKKLNKNFKVEFGLHMPANQDAHLEALFTNHASRWKAKGDSGAFLRNPRRIDFYRLLTKQFFKKDWLRFFYLKVDGKIVAQQYCFEYRGIVYLLQEGFDYAYSKYNIGNVLRSYVFEYCIENEKKTYDFLAHISQHKLKWANKVAEDLCVKIFRRNIKNLIYFYRRVLIRNFKNIVKAIMPPSVVDHLKKMVRASS